MSCSAYTNKLITAKDHAAVQINIGHLNENGQYVDGNFTTFALAGNVRAMVRAFSAKALMTEVNFCSSTCEELTDWKVLKHGPTGGAGPHWSA